MTQLPLEIADKLIDACKAGAIDAGGSLSSALDSAMQIVDIIAIDGLPTELDGPGLSILFHVGQEALVLLLPESTNLLPIWYDTPDATGESKLQTLAQELSMLLLPESLAVDKFAARAVADMSVALRGSQSADPSGCLQLSLTGDDGDGAFYLIWPLSHPDQMFSTTKPAASQKADRTSISNNASPSTGHPTRDVNMLPGYSRSLLSIRVPVVVKLAATKMKVDDVIHLGPGAIIQFDKSCEDTLDLEAGGHKLAAGEAVKVGDKFGLRITSIVLPGERLTAVGK